MSAQLSADMVALKAANQRVKMSMGAERFRAAQAALAAETGGAQERESVASTPPERPHVTADAIAKEQGDLAFLQRAGVKVYGFADAQRNSDQHMDSEAATLSFLERAGAVPNTMTSAREQSWHR